MSIRLIVLSTMCLAMAVHGAVGVYSHGMDPRQHPDDARRLVKPPDSRVLGGRLHFTSLRSMTGGYRESLNRYVDRDRLGDFIWANREMLFRKDVREQAEELKRRNLFLFDIWGFVPGSGPGKWEQFKRPEGVTEMFEEVLGDHWLGMDNGEQDGRYIGGYAGEMVPFGADRFRQYLNFQRHFERMDDLLGNKMATLVSLNFGHHYLRECCYTFIGAETAQALPNSQVYYAFIRGAGKQHGVPWFGNVSVFNRWGWKGYPQKLPPPNVRVASPTGGTSLALLKKLLYAQIFYNSRVVGFEGGFYWDGRYTKDGSSELSPIGRIQRGAVDWSERNGDPGIMHTPVAIMVDIHSGWTFPRHLYAKRTYCVWGTLPYGAGDYLTAGILDMLYPGYKDSSFFRDERGFNTPTPYGDIADCLLSDAPLWLLRQYPLLVLGGRITPSMELRDTLSAYVRQGGELLMTQGNATAMFDGTLPSGGTGRCAVIPGGDWGVESEPQCQLPISNVVENTLANPFPLTAAARAALDEAFRRQRLFGTSPDAKDDGLSTITCRRGPGEYTVCVLNNTWEERPFALTAFAGRILSCEELPTDVSERRAIGFAPNCMTNLTMGADSATAIAAGGVRLFRVKTDDGDAVREIPFERPTPNAGARTLYLRGAESIKEQVLARPTFFRHYDSAMVDARYLLSRDRKELKRERGWLAKQGMGVWVDMSSEFNLFPGYRLITNDVNETPRTAEALAELLEKMELLGSRNLLLALHRKPETNMSRAECLVQFRKVLKGLCRDAAAKGIVVYLRQSPFRRVAALSDLAHWTAEAVMEPNLRPAPSLAAQQLVRNGDMAAVAKDIERFAADVWLVAAARKDFNGETVSLHDPVAPLGGVSPAIEAMRRKGLRIVYDALYPDTDAEYVDAKLFEQ